MAHSRRRFVKSVALATRTAAVGLTVFSRRALAAWGDTQPFAADTGGVPVELGPATKPLWRSDILDRMRLVVMRHNLEPHEAAIPYSLTGRLLGRSNFAGLGTADLKFVVLLLFGLLGSAHAADLRVMKTGLGKGWIEGPGISCGIVATDAATDTDTIATSCNATSTTSITLTARNHAGSTFAGWGGDCPTASGTGNTCAVPMDAMRSVRARFTLDAGVPPLTDLSPSGINTFLTTGAGRSVNTAAEFVAALPQAFREDWILMTRSESLQTGTTEFPRILLLNQNATAAFTLGLKEHTSYPGAHPNAIEYMQWDGAPDQKNFRFHEIIVARVPNLDEIGAGSGVFRFPERPTRGVSEDDQKCFACHSTSNVRNRGSLPGTTGNPIGSVKFKSKPNWDTYDSWGGMLGFNRDRIYKGSIEAAAFRRLMNLWTWQTNEPVRSVIEQLALQPATATRPEDAITRWDTATTGGGANDGRIHFAFDPAFPTVTNEPLPATATPSIDINAAYAFDRMTPTAATSTVVRNADFVVLQHTDAGAGATRFDPDEGRATNFFNNLYLGLNPQRIVDEMSPRAPATNIFATGSVPIDVRPIALAIAQGCITVSGGSSIGSTQTISGVTDPAVLAFLNARNGLSFNDVYDDTRRRAQSMTRRKADIQKRNLDRAGDPYVYGAGADPVEGMIDRYEAGTDGLVPPTPAASKRLRQLRQEVFRRPIGPGHPDETAMGRIYVDREDDSTDGSNDNTAPMSLYRYFLEPLGVPVDKWSMGVRGRSRTYSFADNFNFTNSYNDTFRRELRASLGVSTNCTTDIMPRVTAEFARLPAAAATPTYTDIQRIFNKSCIECHGGLYYPPVRNYGVTLNFTEDENPPAGDRRLWKSLREARSLMSAPTCPPSTPTCTDAAATNVANSQLYSRITDFGNFAHPYDPGNLPGSNEDCPYGVMPCGGPPLSKTDIETIRRWIVGGSPHAEGDPHIKTMDGVSYDFQGAGEFVLLRDDGMELQARQSAVTTAGPLPPDAHTGLSSCVSINTAVAMRVGDHRITYQPSLDLKRGSDSQTPRLQLRIDGKPVVLGTNPIPLQRGGRIVPTNTTGGLEVQIPGGTRVAVTPLFWEPHRVNYMQINVYHGRAVDGIMGAIAPNNWLPRLSNGDFLGPRPPSLAQRHHDLYETFANSWRVDATSSLFYYEPGLSPSSFVVPDWPVAEAIGCHAPPQPGVPEPTQPITAIGQAQAEQMCTNVVEPERRNNCVQDVKATGAAVFAEGYLQSQRLDQRIQIAPPKLVSPARNARIPGAQVVFEWTPVPGTEVIDVTHRHCLWKISERFDFNNCTVLSVDGGGLGGIIPSAVEKYLSPVVCLILFLALLLLAVILFIANKRKAALLVLILALLLAVVCWLHHRAASEPTSVSIQNLEPGEIYRWKVVTDTKDGLVTESETYRFEVEK